MDRDERTRRRFRIALASVTAGALIAVGVLSGAARTVSAAGSAIQWYLVMPSSPGLQREGRVMGLGPSVTAISIESWSWAVGPTINIASQSSGAGAGKVTFSHLKMTRQLDVNSPILFQDAVSGHHFKQLEIVGVRAGVTGGTAPFMTLQLGLAQFAAMSWSASSNAMPQEDLTLSFGAARVSYHSSNAGGAGSTTSGSWNRITNNNKFGLVP